MSSDLDVVQTSSMESSGSDGDSNTGDEYTTSTKRPPHHHHIPPQDSKTSRSTRPTSRQDSTPPTTTRPTSRQDSAPPTTTRPAPGKQQRPHIDSPIALHEQPVQGPREPPQDVPTRGLEGLQKWVVVILVVALCASLCHSLSFASGSWMQNGSTHIGLWMDCNCTSHTPGGDLTKWLTLSKVFLGMALLVAVVTALTIPVYTALEATSRKKTLAKLLYKISDGTLVLALVGCLPAGLLFDIQYKLGVGFGLCLVAALLCLPKHALLAVRKQEDFLYYDRFNWPHAAISLSCLIAAHFLLVCYSVSAWASSGNSHVGLWMTCACGGNTFQDDDLSNALKAVQALITVGEILLLVNVFIMAVLAGLPVTNTRRSLLITSIYILSFAAGITTVIADVMFATKIVEGYSIGYSFIFSILSAVFCIIASCIAVLRRSSARSQTTPMSAA